MKAILIIAALLIVTFAQEVPAPQPNSTLRAVIQIFRHGIRDSIHKKNQNGDLTAPGMRQQFLLGNALRDEYILRQGFLSANYTAAEYKLISSNVDRAIESGYSQLMGLFPNGPHLPAAVNHSLIPQRFFQNDSSFPGLENDTALPFGFQTVPVHASSNEVSSLKGIYEACQTYLQIVDANKRSAIYERLSNEFSATIDQALRLGNVSVESVPREERLLRAAEVYIDLRLDYYNNQETVAIDNQSVFWRNLTLLASISRYVTHFQTDFQKRLTNTPIFEEFRTFLDSKIRKNNPLKWMAYSAHDTNLMQIFAGLNISSWECIYRNFQANPVNYSTPDCFAERPQLSSNIILELHELVQPTLNAILEEDDILVEKKKKRYENFEVRALINGNPVNICGNQTSCNYLEFRNRIKEYIFNEDFHKICGLPEHDVGKNNILTGTESSGTDIFLIIFLMIETVVLVGLFLRFWDDRKERNRIFRGENDGLNIPLRI